MPREFSCIPAAVEAIGHGQPVIVLDAEDRENEGDFVCAAECITPELVNFFITHGKGLLCVSLLPEVAQRLALSPMVGGGLDSYRTAYTITVDHQSVHTGITAKERCRTIQALVNPSSTPADFVRPGHVLPLVAKEGGVLRRAGHTEAAVDLARLAGRQPAGVLCEILDETGERASRQRLLELADEFELEIITIEELIRYRRRSEQLVQRVAEANLPTRYGTFQVMAYEVRYETQQPIVLTMGDLKSVAAPLVRLHSACFTGDLLTSLRCDCGDQLQMALECIGKARVGVLVYLPQEGRGIGLVEKIKAYHLQDAGMDTVEANLALGYQADPRDYGVGIQILKDLGLTQVQLLTNNPKKTDAFIYDGFDLRVVNQIPIRPPANEHNAAYLATKREKMGHHLPSDSGIQTSKG
jgi:3,4-dihydroxy 2-butanone 4-phosphate synthase/GTP cyclohydrolase II